jgi:hypothetical protein
VSGILHGYMHVSGSQRTGLAQTVSIIGDRTLSARFFSESSTTWVPAAPQSSRMAPTGERRAATIQPSVSQIQVPTVFLRMPSVMQMTGLGRSTIYRPMARPTTALLRGTPWRARSALASQRTGSVEPDTHSGLNGVNAAIAADRRLGLTVSYWIGMERRLPRRPMTLRARSG